jgi:hypothetical protein
MKCCEYGPLILLQSPTVNYKTFKCVIDALGMQDRVFFTGDHFQPTSEMICKRIAKCINSSFQKIAIELDRNYTIKT